MSEPLIDHAMNDFREAIRNVAIKFQLSNVMIIGMLEIIQSEISREEMLRERSQGVIAEVVSGFYVEGGER